MSLVSLVLTVRPHESTSVPAALGRAAHALLLARVAQVNPELAHEMHTGSGKRPFTCSSLLGERKNGCVLADKTYVVRYTALTAQVADLLVSLFTPGEDIELDGTRFQVVGAAHDPAVQPWASRTDYSTLSSAWLMAGPTPPARITLHFASPTAFRSGDKAQVFPLPALVFGSLLDKWNAFAPIALAEETRRFAAECLAVSRFEMKTHAAPFKSEGAVKFGAVGQATFSALNRDAYWLSIINLLADYAHYAGVGVGTATGMGQCRRVAETDSTGRAPSREGSSNHASPLYP